MDSTGPELREGRDTASPWEWEAVPCMGSILSLAVIGGRRSGWQGCSRNGQSSHSTHWEKTEERGGLLCSYDVPVLKCQEVTLLSETPEDVGQAQMFAEADLGSLSTDCLQHTVLVTWGRPSLTVHCPLSPHMAGVVWRL